MERRRVGRWWALQAVSGVLLLLLLGSHLVAQHFIVEGGLRTYADVLAYLANPWVQAWEMLFLLVVVLHAGLGVRAVVLDLALPPSAQRWVDRALLLLGLVAVAYGVYLTLSLGRLA